MEQISPPWLVEWCLRELQATPVEILLGVEAVATVFGCDSTMIAGLR